MKKNKFFKTFIVLLCIAVSSCSKDFLDRTPQDRISDGNFWKSSTDLRLYVNNFYNNYLPTYMGYFTFGIYGLDADQGSDNMINMTTYLPTVLNGEAVTPSSGGWGWGSIRNVNYFLNNYQKSTEDWANIQSYVGEALFFKSFLYYQMMQTYGNLPWISKPLVPSDTALLLGPRLSRSVIADSIIANLDAAISYLPSKTTAEPFRINKEIAEALQARIALYEGTWEKYHAGDPFGVSGSDGTKYLQKAADVSLNLINSGLYGLDNVGAQNGYWNLFNQGDYSSSKEIMLWRKYDVSKGLYTLWNAYSKLGTGRGITKSLVDDYLCTDGKPISSSSLYKGDATLVDVATNRDPRLGQTVQINDGNHYITNPGNLFQFPTFHAANEDKCATGYQIYKGHNTSAQQQVIGNGTDGTIYFRYAEVLLIYAEAKATLGTITQGDVDMTINLLRDRVGMPHLDIANITPDPNWKFPSLSPVLNEVRRERRVELAAEGFRHDDIWRWAAADKLIVGWQPLGAKLAQWNGIVAPADLGAYPVNADGYIELYKNNTLMANGYNFKVGRDYLSAIPLDQLTLNPNLKPQNPGW